MPQKITKVLLFLLFIPLFSVSQSTITHRVYFETNTYQIKSSELVRLNQLVSKLDSLNLFQIKIDGFCDDRGSVTYNLELSKKRAYAVKQFLNDNNIKSSVIKSTKGNGELQLINKSKIEDNRKINRRVDIIILLNNGKTTTKQKSSSLFDDSVKIGDKIVLDKLLFKKGYSDLLPESLPALKQLKDSLVKHKHLFFTIQGHVCCTKNTKDAVDRKTKKRNLSQARAKFIYDYLAKHGVKTYRMKYEGLRRQFPLGGNSRYDRRVEILITRVAEKN